jgi:hypothetical protein
MSDRNNKPTRLAETREEIRQVLRNSPYSDRPDLDRIYKESLLTELLAYSAQNLWEVRQRLTYLAQRPTKPKSEQ